MSHSLACITNALRITTYALSSLQLVYRRVLHYIVINTSHTQWDEDTYNATLHYLLQSTQTKGYWAN